MKEATHPTRTVEQAAAEQCFNYAVKTDESQQPFDFSESTQRQRVSYGNRATPQRVARFGDRNLQRRTAPQTQQGAFFVPAVCSMAGRYGHSPEWPVSFVAGSPTRNCPASFCLATDKAVNFDTKENRTMRNPATLAPERRRTINLADHGLTDSATIERGLLALLLAELERQQIPVTGTTTGSSEQIAYALAGGAA
ncbi:hypothetical protein D5085_02750 [Ectothiorhodospiraceae bacterium BW-2]|nr:hypothetical protein D5085_02750 [Ectothiorhodospiraceae bacterium BW-2]